MSKEQLHETREDKTIELPLGEVDELWHKFNKIVNEVRDKKDEIIEHYKSCQTLERDFFDAIDRLSRIAERFGEIVELCRFAEIKNDRKS